jgi:hypothetical protein
MCEGELVTLIGKCLPSPYYCSPNTVYTSILQPAPGASASNNTGARSLAQCKLCTMTLFVVPDVMRGFAKSSKRWPLQDYHTRYTTVSVSCGAAVLKSVT